MNKIVEKTRNFIFAKQTSIFSSAILISVMIIIARLFGFFRYRALSGLFTKEELDIFLASFRIPDLVFEILITGALTSSLIPIFIKYQKNREELNINFSSIVNIIFLALFVFIFILYLSMGMIVPLITPGYSEDKIVSIVFYSRLLLVGQLPFLIAGNLLTGIGQANKMFFLPALAPVFYNVAIIVFALLFSSSLYLLAPILGVVVGALLFLLLQLPILAYSDSVEYLPVIKKTEGMVDFFRILIPRTLTVIVAQIDATIDLVLTTLLGAGSYTVFYFAQHLQLLPVSVIGVAFGQASLPYLSEVYQERKVEEFAKIVVDSILNLFFFTIPISSFFIFARTPLVRLFFGGEKFDWEATVATAVTLSYFSFSLPFHTIYYLITRCFYAFLDTRTPFIISVIGISLNTVMSIVFILYLKLPVWSLAISFSLSMIFNVVCLLILLARRIGHLDFKFLIVESLKMVLATLISSLIAYYAMRLMDGLIFNTSYTINVFFLLVTGGILFVFFYLFTAWLLNVKEIYLVGKIIIKAKEYRKRIIEFTSTHE